MRSPRFIQLHHADHAVVQAELLQGLTAATAHTSPKFLYDALGSRLFEAITELPEYYPTRTEAAIFASHGARMAVHMPPEATLIDLGAGNCHKAASLFATLKLHGINARTWMLAYLQACAANGGTAPTDLSSFLPWSMDEARLQVMRASVPMSPIEPITPKGAAPPLPPSTPKSQAPPGHIANQTATPGATQPAEVDSP